MLLGKKWAYTGGASYAIYKLIPKLKLEFGLSPVMLMKGRKNEVEIQGMIDANIRDAVALIDLASILDKEIGSVEWDELRDEINRMLHSTTYKTRKKPTSLGNFYARFSSDNVPELSSGVVRFPFG